MVADHVRAAAVNDERLPSAGARGRAHPEGHDSGEVAGRGGRGRIKHIFLTVSPRAVVCADGAYSHMGWASLNVTPWRAVCRRSTVVSMRRERSAETAVVADEAPCYGEARRSATARLSVRQRLRHCACNVCPWLAVASCQEPARGRIEPMRALHLHGGRLSGSVAWDIVCRHAPHLPRPRHPLHAFTSTRLLAFRRTLPHTEGPRVPGRQAT